MGWKVQRSLRTEEIGKKTHLNTSSAMETALKSGQSKEFIAIDAPYLSKVARPLHLKECLHKSHQNVIFQCWEVSLCQVYLGNKSA